MIPRIRLAAMACVSAIAVSGLAVAGEGLPRSSPEEQGISSKAIRAFVDAADLRQDFHSIMIMRHGHVVAEGWWAPYNEKSPHALFSLTKSFTSTAIGLAAAEGRLSVDDRVLDFFPDLAPESPSDNLKAMRVSDLLRMSAGHTSEVQARESTEQTKAFLAHPVTFKPGTHFLYNTPASYMLSAIVQKATGVTTAEFLRPCLFEPLGIENSIWATSPEGVTIGGYGLSVRTEDIAKFGQLLLQRGEWNGRQLVPAAWIDMATARQTSNGSNPKSDWDQGYGYQFWRSRHGAYRGDGAFGQFCIVIPEKDTVIAITSGVKNMQSVLDLVWDTLLPALGESKLPADPDSADRLVSKLASLSLRPLDDASTRDPHAKHLNKTYRFDTNDQKVEAITLESTDQGQHIVLHVRIDGVDGRIPCGRGEWTVTKALYGSSTEQAVAATGAWTGDDVYSARFCFYESPFMNTLTLHFAGDQLECDSELNVSFGPTKRPRLLGTAEKTAAP